MTLSEMHEAQEKFKAEQRVKAESGEAQDALEPAAKAADTIELRQWQNDNRTDVFVFALVDESIKLDKQAKNLAVLDTDCSLAIRALLIESQTLTKVISYARRNTASDKY